MTHRRLWLGFAAFVIASGSRWIAAAYLPSEQPPLAEQSLHELVIALVLGVAALRSANAQINRRQLMELSGYGILLLALPSILISLTTGKVPELSGLALLTLVPAATVLFAAQQAQGFDAVEGSRSLLLPALAGTGGALLLIPIAIPSTGAGKLWLLLLALCCLPVTFACIRLHGLLRGVNLFMGVATIFGASALVTGCFSLTSFAIFWTAHAVLRELGFCVFIDAPLALSTAWLLRDLEPVKFTARYLLVPFVSILESMAILHSGLTLSAAVGLGLLLGGALTLLIQDGTEPSAGLKLR